MGIRVCVFACVWARAGAGACVSTTDMHMCISDCEAYHAYAMPCRMRASFIMQEQQDTFMTGCHSDSIQSAIMRLFVSKLYILYLYL